MIMESFLRFPGFLTKACTLSYDDGVKDDAKLIEIMRKYGLKGTFNINSVAFEGRHPNRHSAEEIKAIFGDDTEIAMHGYNHLSLAKVEPALAMRDVVADRECLEKTFGRIIRGMAYANGSYNDEVIDMLRSAGVVYCRTTKATESFDIPDNWLSLHPTCHHNHPRLFELVDEFFAESGKASFWSKKPKLFYLWGHSYEFPRDNNWDVIEKFGQKMAERDDVWHATNMEIYKYVEAFNRLVFSADLTLVENPSAMDVYIFYKGNNILVKAGETAKL
ncbi:MAG: polysaccharide deacetylase [Ruminococcaceae bacterium]|nr:polysaccharide deacetylase [Oscillospiraceae bacterium]